MKNIQILKAFYDLWKVDDNLKDIILRSTRIPPGSDVVFPYALIECEHIEHVLCSASYLVARYKVMITIYCEDKVEGAEISHTVGDLFNYKISLPVVDGCYVLGVWADAENTITDKDLYYGKDVIVVKQSLTLKLSESR